MSLSQQGKDLLAHGPTARDWDTHKLALPDVEGAGEQNEADSQVEAFALAPAEREARNPEPQGKHNQLQLPGGRESKDDR